jgi:cephalosporin hydroxylase
VEHYYQNIRTGQANFSPFYNQMVREHNDGAHFVEVGVLAGKSLVYLGVEIINSGKKIRLDGVDCWPSDDPTTPNPHKFKSRFYNNIKPLEEKLDLHVVDKCSVEAAKLYEDASLDFVFIDACHKYEFIKADIEAWSPKVKAGGILSGHDMWGWGVGRAVMEHKEVFPHTRLWFPHGGCWAFRKHWPIYL